MKSSLASLTIFNGNAAATQGTCLDTSPLHSLFLPFIYSFCMNFFSNVGTNSLIKQKIQNESYRLRHYAHTVTGDLQYTRCSLYLVFYEEERTTKNGLVF